MNRIDAIFRTLREGDRKALMPFITAAHPSLDATATILPAMEQAGASICEIGIPFSDPIADGPVIAASMTEALATGAGVRDIMETIARVRPQLSMGLVAMVSYSIPFRMGVQKFVQQAALAGFDGFIFPDLPLEEAPEVGRIVQEAGLISSLLISPTTPEDRAAAIARESTGFVYVIARTGITGERAELPADLLDRLRKLRNVTDLPITVGFGISKAEHVRQVTQVADAAIVGSALVRCIGSRSKESPQAIAAAAGEFVRDLATGLAHEASASRHA